jgi:hypothetical protein
VFNYSESQGYPELGFEGFGTAHWNCKGFDQIESISLISEASGGGGWNELDSLEGPIFGN